MSAYYSPFRIKFALCSGKALLTAFYFRSSAGCNSPYAENTVAEALASLTNLPKFSRENAIRSYRSRKIKRPRDLAGCNSEVDMCKGIEGTTVHYTDMHCAEEARNMSIFLLYLCACHLIRDICLQIVNSAITRNSLQLLLSSTTQERQERREVGSAFSSAHQATAFLVE